MNDDATMNELAGKYEGMDRFAARKAIVKDLEEAGLLVKIENIYTALVTQNVQMSLLNHVFQNNGS